MVTKLTIKQEPEDDQFLWRVKGLKSTNLCQFLNGGRCFSFQAFLFPRVQAFLDPRLPYINWFNHLHMMFMMFTRLWRCCNTCTVSSKEMRKNGRMFTSDSHKFTWLVQTHLLHIIYVKPLSLPSITSRLKIRPTEWQFHEHNDAGESSNRRSRLAQPCIPNSLDRECNWLWKLPTSKEPYA